MSVRTVTLSDTLVAANGQPLAGVDVTLTLLLPGGAGVPVDLNGEVIDTTPLDATTDGTGAYSVAVIPPGDVQQWSGGNLVALVGCTWQVTYLSTTIISPSFAYTASALHPSAWLSSLATSLTGMIKVYLTEVEANATPDTAASVAITPSQDAVWSGGSGTGQVVSPNTPTTLYADGTGTMSCYLPPTSQLNPNTTVFIAKLPTGKSLPFLVPTSYTGTDRGAWAGGTTYAANDLVEVNGVPYQSLANANTGNNPTSSPTWWSAYLGERITSHLTVALPATSGAISASQILSSLAALASDPVQAPTTLADDETNLRYEALHALPAFSWARKSAAYTLTAGDSGVLVDASAAAVTITLPTAVGATARYAIAKADSNTANAVTVATTSAQTINGAATFSLTQQWQVVELESDGSNWYSVSNTVTSGGGGGGTASFSYATKTADYTMLATDSGIAVDATSNAVTITLPAALSATAEHAVVRVDASANTAIILAVAGQTIGGYASLSLGAQNQGYVLGSDGTNWHIKAAYSPNPLTTEGDLPYWHNGTLSRLVAGSGIVIGGGTISTTPAVDATTSTPGLVELHRTASGTHPIALTADDLGATNGVASLDGSGSVPVSQLANAPSGTLTLEQAGTVVGDRATINLISGNNIALTLADNAPYNRLDVTIAAPTAKSEICVQSGTAPPVLLTTSDQTDYVYSS